MNIVEAVRKLKYGQTAYSKETNSRIRLSADHYSIYYADDIFEENSPLSPFEFNANEWLADDWEIEIEWVDFLAAWSARVIRNKTIKSEFWSEHLLPSDSVDSLISYELVGRWQIID